ncbi:hypothetical protein F5I97DRAFT_1865671 [Phlebopus sp. FC_14]|nr:hypothetical protein F5I97DRAFT_1865671 [Phlebopus sp. FC_14]
MDNLPEGTSLEETVSLSHEDTVPLEGEVLAEEPARAALLNRIGNTKVYLISDSAQARTAKRKRPEQEDDDVDMEEDTMLRGNALFLTGTPISHLPTARIFAYATHFQAHPMALEWLNDNSCILVFETKAEARAALRYLQKSASEDVDMDGFMTAKSIPITLWPPEERINQSLGKGEGLKGTILMRWAKNSDVKKQGAKKESQFYKKYGQSAGKDGDGPQKRRRENRSQVDEVDDDLDVFLGKDRRLSYSPQPSKMRADRIERGARALQERTSQETHSIELKDRVSLSQPGDGLEARPGESRWRHVEEDEHGQGGRGRRNRRAPRPRKTQQDLDDELDAFLNEKD